MLPRSGGLDRSRGFYGDVLGLALHRELGRPPEDRSVVFFPSKRDWRA
jgi:catechol 2,3-dioxygenase-like lactoylglutathione lyase family enzyme